VLEYWNTGILRMSHHSTTPPLHFHMNLNKICVIGVGGVGGYFGGRMAYGIARDKASTRKIFFIARGEHLAHIQNNGLILNTSEKQGMICKPALATDDINEIPIPDLYLICVKSYDLNGVVSAISKRVERDTIIIPLLNGVDIYERIRKILTKGIVLPACVYVGTHIEKPGVVTQKGGDGLILCGKDPEFPAFDPQETIELFKQLKINFTWKDDSYPDIWGKYVFIAAFGLVTAYSGKTLGEVMVDQEAKALVRKIMEEIVAIANKKDIKFPENIIEASIDKANNFPYEIKTSYQRDVETPGRKNEGDLFGGAILRMGQELDVQTPTTQYIFSEIQKKSH
jgi:2-dehydropantoate 2-reductase